MNGENLSLGKSEHEHEDENEYDFRSEKDWGEGTKIEASNAERRAPNVERFPPSL
jgi:hypothetical protein